MYHLNLEGEPGLCRAVLRPCPFGGVDEHYDSEAEARAAYEAKAFRMFGPVDPKLYPFSFFDSNFRAGKINTHTFLAKLYQAMDKDDELRARLVKSLKIMQVFGTVMDARGLGNLFEVQQKGLLDHALSHLGSDIRVQELGTKQKGANTNDLALTWDNGSSAYSLKRSQGAQLLFLSTLNSTEANHLIGKQARIRALENGFNPDIINEVELGTDLLGSTAFYDFRDEELNIHWHETDKTGQVQARGYHLTGLEFLFKADSVLYSNKPTSTSRKPNDAISPRIVFMREGAEYGYIHDQTVKAKPTQMDKGVKANLVAMEQAGFVPYYVASTPKANESERERILAQLRSSLLDF